MLYVNACISGYEPSVQLDMEATCASLVKEDNILGTLLMDPITCLSA